MDNAGLQSGGRQRKEKSVSEIRFMTSSPPFHPTSSPCIDKTKASTTSVRPYFRVIAGNNPICSGVFLLNFFVKKQ